MYHQQHLPPAASVPKPWTGASSAKRQWAPIRAPTPKQKPPSPPTLVAPAHSEQFDEIFNSPPSMPASQPPSVPPPAPPTSIVAPPAHTNGASVSEAQVRASPSMSKEPELQENTPTTVQGATDGAPKMPESLEAAASKHESSTSISGEDKSKTQNLNSALGNLDSILDDLPPIQDQNSSADMSLATSKTQDDDNNNKANTEALDDLTRQLMEALDTNEVVGWKESLDQVPTSTATSNGGGAPFGIH